MARGIFICGTFLAGLAVGLGAIGAHLLESQLPQWYGSDSPRRLEAWHTAVFWQVVHALGLMVLALSPMASCRRGKVVAGLFVVGVLLFSGCLYAWVLSGRSGFVAPVPVGGTTLIVGWIALGLFALKSDWPTGNCRV
jgi:uncharacterized membrane protein YgdD (TMEM256/DUF423 family)